FYRYYQKFVQFLRPHIARNFLPFFCSLGCGLAVAELGSGVLYFCSLVPLLGHDFLDIRKILILQSAFLEFLTAFLSFGLSLVFQYARAIVTRLSFDSALLLFVLTFARVLIFRYTPVTVTLKFS